MNATFALRRQAQHNNVGVLSDADQWQSHGRLGAGAVTAPPTPPMREQQMDTLAATRNGITKVRIILTCEQGHETAWTMSREHANGGNVYCDGCDATDGTWRGVIFNAYDDSRDEA